MRKCLKISLSIVLGLSILFSFFLQNQKASAATDHLVINEVYYNVASDKGKETTNEWVEIYNPTNVSFNLKGWSIGDSLTDKIINDDYIIEPLGFAIITPDASTWSYWSLPAETVKIELKSYIGSGLNNDKDKVSLKDQSKTPIDELSYGSGGLDLPNVAEGHSLERAPAGGNNFVDQSLPTPGVGLPSKTDLSYSNVTEESVELIWTENLDINFKKYLICVSDDDCVAPIQSIENSKITNGKIENLVSGVQYKIKIRVVNLEGGYLDSNIIIILTKKNYSKNIIVNELFPHPSAGTDNEFIELYNASNEDVDLSGWILDDGEAGSSPFFIPVGKIIKANSYLVFYKKETKISLNDDGDSARLFWPDNILVSSSEQYTKADYDMSWSRNINNNWLFSATVTPGSANIFTTKQEEVQNLPILPTGEAKKKIKNSWVKVSGVVIALPGLFGKRVMYIQDKSGGIKIYFDKALWPFLRIGDRVIIKGKISISSGEYQIKVYSPEDIVIIGRDPPPEPVKKIIIELENFIGQLVKVSGKVVKISGSTIWIDDGTGKLRVYFYPATGIKKLGLKKGDWVVIIGVLSKTKAGLRLLPRSKKDIKIYKKAVESKSEPLIVSQVLGIEKAQAIGADYRSFAQPEVIELGKKVNIPGIILIIFGLLSLVSLQIFAKIYKK
ncbi:lamin tail domain-containing protein [Patescibacteria group bacterium]|nr:lamin tail domain-containing protein [Patescibacteria group bacterium]